MKRHLGLVLILTISLLLGACEKEKIQPEKMEDKLDTNKINSVQRLIDEFNAINDATFDLFDPTYNGMNYWEYLYLSENGEVCRNEWTVAYEKALDAYNALSDIEKNHVFNTYSLFDGFFVGCYNSCLVEQKIAVFCKDAVVEELKERLINKSSYQEYGWTVTYSYYNKETHEFSLKLEIDYSATNRMGGRIDATEYAYCNGLYDGKEEIIITSIS